MSGFKKPKPQQIAVKLGLYGPAGSGKTFTALEIAEGMAKQCGKRVALVDTEHGSDFYAIATKRDLHPKAFDFDALYSRSITEVSESIRGLDTKVYGIVILDSISHLWEAAIDAYSGRKASGGQIPFHAWGNIKKPYKDLINFLLNSPLHVIICGRQKNIFEEDAETGETKMVGVGMKAESETPYEPHVLIRLGRERSKSGAAPIIAYVEKDRSGMLSGKSFTFGFPDQEEGFTFSQLGEPLLSVLTGGTEQAHIASMDETSAKDAEALTAATLERESLSDELRRQYCGRFDSCETLGDLDAASKELTPKVKADMLKPDIAACRESYTTNLKRFK